MSKDLLILAPDKNTQFVLEGLLSRTRALRIRPLVYQIYLHPERDPGVFHKGAEFIRPFHSQYERAFIFLDREGSGQEQRTAEEIEYSIRSKAEKFGWKERVEVITFDPELEIWAWVQSPRLARNLGWRNLNSMRTFIEEHGFWLPNTSKPHRPKEAIEIALKESHIPRSSAIYKKIAESVSFKGCTERSFLNFKETLQKWFPIEN